MVGDNAAKKLKDVSLSNNIICRRIEDVGVDITDQLICRLKAYEFAIQLDKATFGVHDAYLICYVRYLFQAEKRMVEDMLFCKPLELRCRVWICFTLQMIFSWTTICNGKMLLEFALMEQGLCPASTMVFKV